MKKIKLGTKEIVIIGVMAALVFASQLMEKALPRMPQGGTVKLSETMIGIAALVFAIIFGKVKGFVMAVTLSIVSVFVFTFTGAFEWIEGPYGFMFDYLIPFMVPTSLALLPIKKWWSVLPASVIVFGVIFASHTISGMVVYEVELWPSIVYNSTYMLPSLIFSPTILTLVSLNYKKVLTTKR